MGPVGTFTAFPSGPLVGLARRSYEAYTRGGYGLDFVAPLVGMMAYLEGARLLARRRLTRAFGECGSPEVMERVLRDAAALGGEVRTVTVLMSDREDSPRCPSACRPRRSPR